MTEQCLKNPGDNCSENDERKVFEEGLRFGHHFSIYSVFLAFRLNWVRILPSVSMVPPRGMVCVLYGRALKGV